MAYKVLADNSQILAKLGQGYRDVEARGIETYEGDEAAGRRKMMLDLGLTASELAAGLAGKDVRSWMSARAVASGMAWPEGNPRFQRELAHVLQDNARAHGVGLAEYMLLEPSTVRTSMGRLYGSGMSGTDYLLSGMERDPMDWSGRTQADMEADAPHVMFAGKVLSSNTPSEELLVNLDEEPPELSWSQFEKDYGNSTKTVGEVGRENVRLPNFSNLPEIQL